MHEIRRDPLTYRFDRKATPRAVVDSGDYLMFHTLDAHSGTIPMDRIWADVPFPELDENTGNPVTGPVFVKGARAGGTLKVRILQILPDEVGILPIRSYMGILRGVVEERTARVVRFAADRVWISERVSVPARPMIGTIGVAPAGEAVATALPGSHGGNLDDNLIATGAEVFFPVACDGALLGLGDVHAAMGDSELTCGGADIPARVLVQVEALDKPFKSCNPTILRDGMVVTHGFGNSYEDASEMAAREMLALLVDRVKVSEYEAVLLMAARADLGLCQACRCHVPMIVRTAFPVLW
jgi:amidase